MSLDPGFDSSDDAPWADAPLFRQFWKNGELNASRAVSMGQRIALDAARPGGTPGPVHSRAAVPLPDLAGDAAAAWQRRHSTRAFGPQAASVQDLGALLHPLRARRHEPYRLLPSGGAKYPIQTYVALCRLDGPRELAGRIAWYDSEAHGLTPVRDCPAWETLARVLGVDWPDEPAAVIFLIARPENMLAKYGERGGRFMLLEAGAYLGALGYQAAQADWGGCAIGSFHDAALLSLLGLDAERHLAVLAYACGP